MGVIWTLSGQGASSEFSFGQGDLLVGHLYGDLQWTAGHTGLEETQLPSLPWRVLLWSERNRNVNILIIDQLQFSAVKANWLMV